jgi:hypothetical protein
VKDDELFSSSPAGPFSLGTLSSASSASSLAEDLDARPCLIRYMDGDVVTREQTITVRRLDVVLRRKLGDSTYVVARARSERELLRCRVNRTFHMHSLRMSADCRETFGYASYERACADDVNDISLDEHTANYFVVNDDPFDARLYGVARVQKRDANAVASRFGISDVCATFGVDAIVDRFFASSKSNEIFGGGTHESSSGGAEFVRKFMLDALRIELSELAADRTFTVPILSSAPIRGDGVLVHNHVRTSSTVSSYDGIMTDADVMAEREDFVMRRFFKLYSAPCVSRSNDRSKSWRGLKSPLKIKHDYEDIAEEDDLVTTFHAVVKRINLNYNCVNELEDRAALLAAAREIAQSFGLEAKVQDDAAAFSIIDAVTCSIRNDDGMPSHRLEFDTNTCSSSFAKAVRMIRGDEPAAKNSSAIVCSKSSSSLARGASGLIESLLSSMTDADLNTCILITSCITDEDGALVLNSAENTSLEAPRVSTRDLLIQAAARGIFTEGGVFRAKLNSNGDTIIATRFTRRQFAIRPSSLDDAKALVAIEAEAWIKTPEMKTSPSAVIERLTNNALMNFIVEDIDSSAVCGAMYTQFIDNVDAASGTTWETKESNRREVASTNVVQLLDVFVDQAYGARCATGSVSVGQELRNYVLHYAEHSNVQYACAVTRTRGFRQTQARSAQRELEYEDYVYSSTVDRGTFFHTSAGAEIIRIVPKWRANDYENAGNGVLIRYDVSEYAFAMAAKRGRLHRSRMTRRPSDPTLTSGGSLEYANAIQAVAWEARARMFPVR